MDYRLLGQTGMYVSPLCLGTFNFGRQTPEKTAIYLIHKALDAGINFIDTANVYNEGESERVIGKALADGRRDKTIIATKVHFQVSDDPNDRGNSRRHISQAVERSLKRLNTNYIDLYQIHRPVFDMDQFETLRALDDLITQGKVRYIGCSTHPAWMVMEALAISDKYGLARYVTEQPPYNLLDRRIENELIPLAQRYKIGLIPWSPLGMGILVGRYKDVDNLPRDSRAFVISSWSAERVTKKGIEEAQRFIRICNEYGLKPSQLALLWVKEQPGITSPIIGPRIEAHLDDLLEVLDLKMDPEITKKLDDIFPPGKSIVNFHNNSGWMKG